MKITENFDSVKDNMQCPCCNAFDYDDDFMTRIQTMRYVIDTPFILDRRGGGFYRCRFYNDDIGGAKNSQHLHGRAMDISTSGWSGNTKWFFISEAIHYGLSIGVYENFFHVDFRPGLPVVFYGSN